MVKMTLLFIIAEIIKALTTAGLSAGTLGMYRKYFDKMQNYFLSIGEEYCSEKVLENYWESLVHREKPYSARYLSSLYRTINLVKEYYATGSIVWTLRKKGSSYNPCCYYQKIITDSINRLHLVGSTLQCYDTIVRKFCCKLESLNISNFHKVTNSIVFTIITEIGSENSRSMGNVIIILKKFFSYLEKVGLCKISISSSFFLPYKGVNHIPSFSREEIKAVLRVCDRTTSIGKRNYSILLLAVTCGLRRCDIMELKLCDINWHRYELRIVQRKTKKFILLPLLGEVGNSIADYILSARPENSSFENIFLTVIAPVRPMGPTAYNDMLSSLCSAASVQKIGRRNFHSLRRSTGTWMANSGVPVTTISQVLGHSQFHSADRYISADPQMVSCSLDFTGILPTSEVYR